MTIYFLNEYNKAQPIPETRKKKGKSPTHEKTHIITEKHPTPAQVLQSSTVRNTQNTVHQTKLWLKLKARTVRTETKVQNTSPNPDYILHSFLISSQVVWIFQSDFYNACKYPWGK